jgi:hypothetical protein
MSIRLDPSPTREETSVVGNPSANKVRVTGHPRELAAEVARQINEQLPEGMSVKVQDVKNALGTAGQPSHSYVPANRDWILDETIQHAPTASGLSNVSPIVSRVITSNYEALVSARSYAEIMAPDSRGGNCTDDGDFAVFLLTKVEMHWQTEGYFPDKTEKRLRIAHVGIRAVSLQTSHLSNGSVTERLQVFSIKEDGWTYHPPLPQ